LQLWPKRSSPADIEHRRETPRFVCATPFAALLVAAAAVLPCRSAHCDPGARAGNPKVVLVRMASCCGDSACPNIEALLHDELESTALDFLTVEGTPSDLDGSADRLVERLGENRGVALRLSRAQDGAACEMELWVQGKNADQTAHKTIRLSAASAPDAAVNAAIESAEAVFAALLEMKLIAEDALRHPSVASIPVEPVPRVGATDAIKKNPSAAPPETSAAVADKRDEKMGERPAPLPPRDKRLGIGVGAALIWSPGGIGPMGAIRLSFDTRPTAWLSLRADAWLTVIGRDIERGSTAATFDAAVFRLVAFFEFLHRGWARPAMGICGGGAVTWSKGVAGGGESKEWEVGLAGYAGGAGRFAAIIGEWFRAEIGLAVGAVLPEVAVRFSGDDIAAFGLPVLDAYAQIEVSFL
jgi:hypothetical protein